MPQGSPLPALLLELDRFDVRLRESDRNLCSRAGSDDAGEVAGRHSVDARVASAVALLSGAPLAVETAPATEITLQQVDANGLAALRRNDWPKLRLAVEATSAVTEHDTVAARGLQP